MQRRVQAMPSGTSTVIPGLRASMPDTRWRGWSSVYPGAIRPYARRGCGRAAGIRWRRRRRDRRGGGAEIDGWFSNDSPARRRRPPLSTRP